MANMIKIILEFLTITFIVLVVTYVVEYAMIGTLMQTLLNYITTSSLSAAVKVDISGRILNLKTIWRTVMFVLWGSAMVWLLFNVFKSEADESVQ